MYSTKVARSIVECPGIFSCFTLRYLYGKVGALRIDGGVHGAAGIGAGVGLVVVGAGGLTGGAMGSVDGARTRGATGGTQTGGAAGGSSAGEMGAGARAGAIAVRMGVAVTRT